ncbi:NAD(P)-binding protein [Hypoxylon fragiforme]|uniref:NAD(P)-binding protein n=1 Tax=Hypoxylon fragiforme TaxID=63214 RepID=UPI0020C665F2|nr:NAD(P)-binding protein [Hypoxylon fragiforme]KAI2605283.1 NAD(P)-binding protein [Hypoxylon fragiforme]
MTPTAIPKMLSYFSPFESPPLAAGTTLLIVAATVHLARRIIKTRSPRRHRSIRPSEERVLIIGASSGLGRAIAKKYATRSARICIVARRAEALSVLAKECGEQQCIWEVADFSNVEDMVRVRERLREEWGGLDTLYVCAGVSAVQPVMSLAGIGPGKDEDASASGIQNALDITARATQGNVYGPLVAAVAFIPMLTRTSAVPAVLLVSSVAAVVPAPTRALYAATKASSLLLFQSLAIEHPKVAFSFVLPATIEGNFRASAVDAGPEAREAEPNQHGLKLDYVANRCLEAVDRQVTGNVVVPWFPYALAHHLYYLWPSFIERKARKKYNFGQY